MSYLCNDNRFELIEKYKKELIEATNIESASDEMAVLDDILFRFWQMGWLDKLELPSAQPEIIHCKDCKWFRKEYGWNCIEYTVCGISPMHHPIRREEDFCSRAERRTDEDMRGEQDDSV